MLTKFFVAFTFRSDTTLSRKIDGFKKRFDPKYRQRSFPHMALLAPFEILKNEADDLVATLKEELDTFFYGHTSPLKLSFSGVGAYQNKRKFIVYLNPVYSPDLEFCSEIVHEICQSMIPKNIKYKPNAQQFLPLGYMQNEELLGELMSQAKLEFDSNSDLTISGLALYEQRHGIWFKRENLISFEGTKDPFLQLQQQSL